MIYGKSEYIGFYNLGNKTNVAKLGYGSQSRGYHSFVNYSRMDINVVPRTNIERMIG